MRDCDTFIYDGSLGGGKNHRCSICNKVNVPDIETNIGEYDSDMSFVRDPSDRSQFICVECDSAVREAMFDFQLEDFDKEDDPKKRQRLWNSKY